METEKTVLSIQSHVTHGYVGNKAAVFPLQVHGFDVDPVNTVSLSNHSGYPIIRGHRMDLAEYLVLMEGLRGNDFLKSYHYLLSGYINNKEIVCYLSETVNEIRESRQKAGLGELRYICDPVLGDNGVLYCKNEVVEAYRSILHIADVLTPNYFEASVLSGVDVKDLSSAITAAEWFHTKGTACVVIKSFPVLDDPSQLQFLVSIAERNPKDRSLVLPPKMFTGKLRRFQGHYTGTGDIFGASLLAFYHNHSLETAVGKAMSVLQDLIKTTYERCGGEKASLSARELRVTDSTESLLRPKAKVLVEPLDRNA
ncbi:unnamed protein product [Phytomonas sp. Hart1]|nr:unnamed protein product [Phytomonas sp. Hart1]|eukprot:CCW68030.1 unnamed protein product [Phytomonas sp. isolate Hart1]